MCSADIQFRYKEHIPLLEKNISGTPIFVTNDATWCATTIALVYFNTDPVDTKERETSEVACKA
jgi:hypothetical protein